MSLLVMVGAHDEARRRMELCKERKFKRPGRNREMRGRGSSKRPKSLLDYILADDLDEATRQSVLRIRLRRKATEEEVESLRKAACEDPKNPEYYRCEACLQPLQMVYHNPKIVFSMDEPPCFTWAGGLEVDDSPWYVYGVCNGCRTVFLIGSVPDSPPLGALVIFADGIFTDDALPGYRSLDERWDGYEYVMEWEGDAFWLTYPLK